MGSRERIGSREVAKIMGEPLRTVQAMAADGKIPSAAQLLSSRWTFDEKTIRAWIKDREDEVWRKSERRRRAPIGAAKPYGADLSSRAGRSDGAYERTMSMLRSGGSRPAATAR